MKNMNENQQFRMYELLTEEEAKKKDGKQMFYGLPDQKKYPMYDAKHVKLAVKFFNHVDPKDESRLAAAIKKRAKALGVELSAGKDNRFAKYISKSVVIKESILDPVQKTRCREIFDENDIMHPEVKDFIESSFQKWYDQLNDKNFRIKTYYMIGSSTGFQYTDTSDIDIQVFIEMLPGHDFSETRKYIHILPNGNNVPNTLHPVNYFFVDVNDPTKMIDVENFYCLDTGVWEKKSNIKNVFPIHYLRDITKFLANGFDIALNQFERDKQYLEDAYKLDPDTQEISEKERQEEIDKCIIQFKADIDSLKLGALMLHGFMREAYEKNKYFSISIDYKSDEESPRLSINNAIYKTLDKFEYKERMWAKVKEGRELLKKYEDAQKKEAIELTQTGETEPKTDIASDVAETPETSPNFDTWTDEQKAQLKEALKAIKKQK